MTSSNSAQLAMFAAYKSLPPREKMKVLNAIGDLREIYYNTGKLPSAETAADYLVATGNKDIAKACYNAQVKGELWP